MNSLQEDIRLLEVITNTYNNCEDVSLRGQNFFIPAIKIKSSLFGNRIISLPFLDVGGIFGKVDNNKIKKFKEQCFKEKNLRYIEIKLNESQSDFDKNKNFLEKEGFEKKDSKEQFYIQVENPDIKWKKFHKHTRNEIRKAKKSGLNIKIIRNKKELKKFYKLYFREMKRFGTPCHSRQFFYNLLEHFKKDFFGVNCYFNNELIASGIMIFEKKISYLWFNVSNPKYRIYKPNDLIYWTMIKEAFKKNVDLIDAGQVDSNSENERERGLLKFKEKWIGKRYKKNIFYYSKDILLTNKEEKKNRLKGLRTIWKKLPSPIIKLIGPKVTSELGV